MSKSISTISDYLEKTLEFAKKLVHQTHFRILFNIKKPKCAFLRRETLYFEERMDKSSRGDFFRVIERKNFGGYNVCGEAYHPLTK